MAIQRPTSSTQPGLTAADLTAANAPVLAAVAAAPVGASPAALAAAKAEIISALAGSGAVQGEVRRFISGAVPVGWQSLADDPIYPSKGILLRLQNSSASPGVGAYVTTGTGAGYWRYAGTVLQRLDLATAAAVGPAYPCGISRGTQSKPFMVAIGKYLYMGGGSTAANAPLADLMRFDTETGAAMVLAALPRAVNSADAVLLDDGRILFWCSAATGLTQTPASTAFWFYNPATNFTAVEVLASLPLLNTIDQGRNLVKMPSGAVMVIEGTDATPATATSHTTRYSCLLTISGNSIVAGPAENCGASFPAGTVLLASPAGAHVWRGGQVQRSYVEGVGWGAAALTCAHVQSYAGTDNATLGSAVALPENTGWFFIINNNGANVPYVLLTGANSPGAPLLYAKKL